MRDKTAGHSADWQEEAQAQNGEQSQDDPQRHDGKAKEAASKFSICHLSTAQLLANRLEHEGHLFTADMAALIRENIANPWPQELADYVADRLEGRAKGPHGRSKSPNGAENRLRINLIYRDILPVLQGKPSQMDEESKAALLETRRTEFPDDPPYLVADKLLARGFFGSDTHHRKIRALIRSQKP